MIGTLLVIIYLMLCVWKNAIWILSSLILIFPAHLTIKQLLQVSTGSIGIFPLWYDIAIFTLLIKSFYYKHFPIKQKGLIILFVIVLCYYFSLSYFTYKPDPESLSTFRIYLHCLAIFTSLSILKFTKENLRQLKTTLLISSVIYSITGILIYFFFQYEAHLLLGHIEFINGSIQYTTPSFLIMGIERMFGLIGGPNQFGVFLSIIILYIYFIMNNTSKHNNIRLIKISLILSITCCIFTFSRAGWGIIVMTIGLVYVMKGKLSNIIGLIFSMIIVLGVIFIILYYIAPDFANIIMASFTGEEASASVRGDIIKNGFSQILENMLGHGLGTCIEENGSSISESSIIICLYEIGIIGTALYYYLMIHISYILYKKKLIYSKLIFSLTIATIIASVVSMNPFQFPYIYFYWGTLGLATNKSIQKLNYYYL